jgi:tetratricopeptide (TPR) repeat protein
VADPWDTRNTRWETLFDQAVTLAAARRLSDTLSMLKRIRSWQHRQNRYGKENHDWHDAELLWLQGVVLERARQPSKADPVWLRLARVYKDIARLGESAFLPRCTRCAERVLGFAPSWFSVATQLRDRAADVSATSASFRQLGLGSDDGGIVGAIQRTNSAEAELSREGPATPRHAATSPNKSKLLAKREAIRKTYRDLEQPATVVELCEQYLKLESADGVVWAWYGHSLSELGRYGESAGALQTARGLVTTEDTRAFVFQCQGDLEYGQGRYSQAAEFYREAVAEGVGDWALIMLGRVLFRLAATDEAEQCLRQAVAMKGSHPATALLELGRILRSRSALFESRRVLRQALALESHDDIRECLADVERAIRLQSPAGGRPKKLPPTSE